MELTKVESSHVAAIGYLETERVLLVRYKDGSLYAITGVLPEKHEQLMASSSKGAFLYALDKHGNQPVKIGKVHEFAFQSTPQEATQRINHTRPLDVIDEDADKCCRRQLGSYLGGEHKTEPFECSACGTQLYPERIGANVYWRIKSNVLIVRK